MGYKIRVNDDAENYDEQIQKYKEHLAQFNKRKNTDLWKYFYWDFFHDGDIEDIHFTRGSRQIAFHMSCPNIKRLNENSYEYINVEFKCEFRNVIHFHLDAKDADDFDDTDVFEFNSSEINTLSDMLDKDDDEYDYYSIIMKLYTPGGTAYLEMVFEGLYVEAIENTAYEIMLGSDKFDVPIYEIP